MSKESGCKLDINRLGSMVLCVGLATKEKLIFEGSSKRLRS
jgi:hypothetical protein